ncbi:hypothetical protein B0H19DRAFT_1129551 [Mycena capillaripes]|nr:hypothetical protein B0H19DRAFT_1129551 [Mycena capillaripes]
MHLFLASAGLYFFNVALTLEAQRTTYHPCRRLGHLPPPEVVVGARNSAVCRPRALRSVDCSLPWQATTYTSSTASPWSTGPPRPSPSTRYTPTPAPTSNCMTFQSAVIFTDGANVTPLAQGEDQVCLFSLLSRPSSLSFPFPLSLFLLPRSPPFPFPSPILSSRLRLPCQSPRLHPTAHRIRRDSLLASAPLPFPSPPPPYPRAELMTLSPSSPPLSPDHVSLQSALSPPCYLLALPFLFIFLLPSAPYFRFYLSVNSNCYRLPPLFSFPSPDCISSSPLSSAAGIDLILSALRTTFIYPSVASPRVSPSTLPLSPPLSSSFSDILSPQ